MLTLTRRLALLGGVLLGGCRSAEASPSPVVTPLCGVAENPRAYHDRVVTLDAYLFTDWRDVSGLMSEACPKRILAFDPLSPVSASMRSVWDEMLRKKGHPERALRVVMTARVVAPAETSKTILVPLDAVEWAIVGTPADIAWAARSW